MKFVTIGAVLLAAALSGPVTAADTIRFAVEDLPARFAHPFRSAQQILAAIFDPLTAFDEAGTLTPVLATGWENRDPLTWRLTLRSGVRFSNGAVFDAAAVITAVEHLIRVATVEEIVKRQVPFLAAATAVDSLTVDIVTAEPVPLFPRYASAILIPEPGAWRALGPDAFARQPIGTGAFMADQIASKRWTLSAAPSAWRQAKVSGVELLMLPDTSARVQALESARIDVATVVGADNIEAIEAGGGRVLRQLSPAVYGFTLITTRGGPLADRRVRQAINLAVDRKTIIDQLLGGTTIAANQPAARVAFGHDPAIADYPYDPTAAKRLLAEAGYPDGFAFQLDAPLGASAGDTSVFQRIQADLKAVGIAVTIRTMPNALYLERVNRTEFEGDAFPIAWPAWPTLDVWRALQVHSCLRPVPWYCDRAITDKMLAARAEWDTERALALRREIGRHYHDDAPALFLYELPALVGLGPRVKSFRRTNTIIAFHDLELHP
jgi:peptide/nickel transport system substrate-binding protein